MKVYVLINTYANELVPRRNPIEGIYASFEAADRKVVVTNRDGSRTPNDWHEYKNEPGAWESLGHRIEEHEVQE